MTEDLHRMRISDWKDKAEIDGHGEISYGKPGLTKSCSDAEDDERRKAASQHFISSWQQRIVAGPCSPAFQRYATLPRWHDVRKNTSQTLRLPDNL